MPWSHVFGGVILEAVSMVPPGDFYLAKKWGALSAAAVIFPRTLPMSTQQNPPVTRLSLMMFLQFFIWGSWFSTLWQVLGGHGLGDFIGKAYQSAPLAAMIAPLFLGLIADRWFASEKVMGTLLLIGGGLMMAVPGAVKDHNGGLVVWLFIGHMLCFMPTLGLGNTIAFSNLTRETFPKVRVWGTIGWIAAGLVGGFLGWSASLNLFWMAAGCSVALGLYCFTLPNTPAPSAGKPIDLRALLMLDAFKLLAKPSFFVFVLSSMLICVPLACYFANTSGFLANMGFAQPASAMTVGQMSEIVFMLLIPAFFRKLGVKWMILVGMVAWAVRYLLFAFGASTQAMWMVWAGIAIHGICYDFFFVTGFMYTDRTAPVEIRGQAQSMLVFFTQGVGMFFGYMISAWKLAPVKVPSDALAKAIADARGTQETLSFAQQFGQMFSVNMPAGVDSSVISAATNQWHAYWLFPVLLAAGVAVLFLVAFWENSDASSQKAKSTEEYEPEVTAG